MSATLLIQQSSTNIYLIPNVLGAGEINVDKTAVYHSHVAYSLGLILV